MANPALQEILRKSGLPIVPYLETIRLRLREEKLLILTADPGAGKSTLVPLALLEGEKAPLSASPSILLLEPRRLAAVGIARHMADLLAEKVGDTVGYSVRLDRRVSSRTRIEVLTEGLFIRRIQEHPDLPGIEYVIFDEFHERSSATDLAFAFVMDLLRMGHPLRVLIMSATLDTERLETFCSSLLPQLKGRSFLLHCPGSIYPLDIQYRPLSCRAPLGVETARTILEVLDTLPSGHSLLAFLPGKGEIAQAQQELCSARREGMVPQDVAIFPLHGALSLEEQRRVLSSLSEDSGASRSRRPKIGKASFPRRRIVLATTIAETSLTVPGVSLVLDTGLIRLERFHQSTGMNRLSLEEASMASVAQRAGRAARTGPGRCIRLWDPALPRPAETEPEIRRTELSALVLEAYLWGVRSPEELPWLEPPPSRAWEEGHRLLYALGCIDPKGVVLPAGYRAARLGIHPRLAALVLAAEDDRRPAEGCFLAALLADRDGSGIADEDLRLRLEVFGKTNRWFHGREKTPWRDSEREGVFLPDVVEKRERALPRGSQKWCCRVFELAQDLAGRIGCVFERFPFSSDPDNRWVGKLLVRAYPDRICRFVERGRFQFPSGRTARLEGSLAGEHWLVAPAVDAGIKEGRIHLAVPLTEDGALAGLQPLMVQHTAIVWEGLVPRTVKSLWADRLLLKEERQKSTLQEVLPALCSRLEKEGCAILPWDDLEGAPRRFIERLRFWVSHGGPALDSDWSEESLVKGAAQWLGGYLWYDGEEGEGPVLNGKGLLQALYQRLGWEHRSELDKAVPEYFTTPRGRRHRIEYDQGFPLLRIRIQEVFGVKASPSICGVPLVFHLLSPADRPIQVTDNLERFWGGSYTEVRKEMKGRYPKHFWPEDPSSVTSTPSDKTREKPLPRPTTPYKR